MKSLPLLLLAFLTAGALTAPAQSKSPEIFVVAPPALGVAKDLSPEQQRRVRSFETVWSTLNNSYFDRTFNGLDWNKIHSEYLPKVTAAKTDLEFHAILEQLLSKLGKSHFGIITPEYFAVLENAKAAARQHEKHADAGVHGVESDDPEKSDDVFQFGRSKYGVGGDLRQIGEDFVFSRVEEGSSAAEAGIKPGFILKKVNGVSLEDVVRRVNRAASGGRDLQAYLPIQIQEYLLNGQADTSVSLTFVDAAGGETTKVVPRHALPGRAVSLGANYPEQYLSFETRSLSDKIGYVRFNLFALPMIENLCSALTEFKDKEALIIDLRGNLGGIIGSIVGLSGMLTDHDLPFGRSVYRSRSEVFTAVSRAKNFKGRLVVLVDHQSMSAAEIFTAGLKGNYRATVVGERTAGAALPASSIRLETGAVFMYPVANYLMTDDKAVEGVGVEPDLTVALDRASLLKGQDPQVEAAIAITKKPVASPPPVKEMRLTRLGSIDAPPPPKAIKNTGGLATAPKSAIETKDAKSLEILNDFSAKLGPDGKKRLGSYRLAGSAELTGATGTVFQMESLRDPSGKFVLSLTSESTGQIREVYDGKRLYLQTSFGIDREMPVVAGSNDVDVLAPINLATDPANFVGLKFEGAFPLNGRSVNTITGITKTGLKVGLAFDTESKMLISFAQRFGGFRFDDYRDVNGTMMPFTIDMEGSMKLKLSGVDFSPAFDAASFARKEMCYDKPL